VVGKNVGAEDRKRIEGAVREAEAQTGLQFCVYLGPAPDATRSAAERAFQEAGLHERPAVLLLVSPQQRRVEIITAPHARERLTDEECAAALTEMTPYFARNEFIEGLLVGLAELAERTGPGTAPDDGPDLPNVLG
jgi:uncharacterized membrane protein YgcG